MPRLIDADALDSVVLRMNTKENAQITRGEYKLIDSVIFEFPTIDALQVIRCKDCKYNMQNPRKWADNDKTLTYVHCGFMSEDDYCSKAVRKEENDGQTDN